MLEKRDVAFRAFRDGDYRTALWHFYRLPGGMSQSELDRYKVNAWFNLGVLALKGASCAQARSHFGEANDLAPRDTELLRAFELARICGRATKDRAYFLEINSLAVRALED